MVFEKSGLSRREFLRLGGAGLAWATLFGATACGGEETGQATGSVELTFSNVPDPTGTVKKLIDQFNREYKGEIHVKLRVMSADVTKYLNQLRTEFQAGGGDIDVIGGDVIWPAQFAENGWIVDLSDRFADNARAEFLTGALQSNLYKGGVWGVPWHIAVGMLYYRRDLLERSGFSEPPGTWAELKDTARKVQQDRGTRSGFVFQGAEYEGGVCDGLEYIWTHGGNVLDPEDPEKVVIDSPESAAGLRTERSMVDEGVAPDGVVTYTEEESQGIFFRGDAVFMRNWPDLYALAADPEQSRVRPEQIGVSTLPVGSEEYRSTSSSGGFNLYINAASDKQDEAWEFIKFMTAPEQQKFRVLNEQRLPTREGLYSDKEVEEEVPVVALGREAIQNARPRPVSPYYSDMSLEMAEQFNKSLKGEVDPEQAVETLQRELEEMVEPA